MAKGWTCARCATENPESVISCQGCGMIRGAVVTTPPGQVVPPAPPGWASSQTAGSSGTPPPPPLGLEGIGAPPPGPAAPVPGWTPAPVSSRRRFRFPIQLIVIAVLIGGGSIYALINNAGRSSSGEINKAGELAVGDLRVGDCFDLADPAASAVDKTTAKPCTDSHQYEVFFAGTLPDGAYPDDTTVKAYVEANCLPVFGTYVGMVYDNSKLEIVWFSPIEEGWNQGDRAIQCTVYDPNNSQLTASLKGARR